MSPKRTAARKEGAPEDSRSKSNYLRRRRVARARSGERRDAPNGVLTPPRRRV